MHNSYRVALVPTGESPTLQASAGASRLQDQLVRPRASRTTTWVSSGRELTVTWALG